MGVLYNMVDKLDKYQYEHINRYLGLSWPILFINAQAPICIINKERDIILSNKSFNLFIEYTFDELLNKKFEDLLYSAEVNNFTKEIDKIDSLDTQCCSMRVRHCTKTGKNIWGNLLICKTKQFIESDDYVYIVFIMPMYNDLRNELVKLYQKRSNDYDKNISYKSKIFLFFLENWKSAASIITCIIGIGFGVDNAITKIHDIEQTQLELQKTQEQLIKELQKHSTEEK